MQRGLPRPRRPIDGMPVPYNVPGPESLGSLHQEREQEVFLYNLCQTCGLELDEICFAVAGPMTWLGLIHRMTVLDNGALHERCLRLALTWCPHLRGQGPDLKIYKFSTHRLQREDGLVHHLLIPDDAEEVTDQFHDIYSP